jgi:hypothetical protein
MKKLLLLLICVCGLASTNFAQSSSEIQLWQNQHPELLLMKQEQFYLLPKSTQVKIESKVVFFENLSAALQAEKSNSTHSIQPKDEEQTIIKNWLGLHPDVKVIPKSIYDTLSEERITMYQSISSLFLEGETITARDIQNYH